jgi:hypothetical protein
MRWGDSENGIIDHADEIANMRMRSSIGDGGPIHLSKIWSVYISMSASVLDVISWRKAFSIQGSVMK